MEGMEVLAVPQPYSLIGSSFQLETTIMEKVPSSHCSCALYSLQSTVMKV